jgi:hypothetical protein
MCDSTTHAHLQVPPCPESYDGRHEYLVDIRTQLKPVEPENEISVGLVCACGARARAYYKLVEISEGEV